MNCAQILTIHLGGPGGRVLPPRGESTVRAIGRLGPATMARVDQALRASLAI